MREGREETRERNSLMHVHDRETGCSKKNKMVGKERVKGLQIQGKWWKEGEKRMNTKEQNR